MAEPPEEQVEVISMKSRKENRLSGQDEIIKPNENRYRF